MRWLEHAAPRGRRNPARRGYDPSATWLHGGPDRLEGGTLKRYMRHGSDMGALFFSPDTPTGRQYAMWHAAAAWPPAIYRVQVDLPADRVFDFGRAGHRARLAKVLSGEEQEAVFAQARRSGQLEWAHLDEDPLREAGFDGALLFERAAGVVSEDAVVSLAVFDPRHVRITGRFTREELERERLRMVARERP